MEVTDLPTLNASLNLLAAICLAFGYYFIRRGDRRRHRLCMLAACGLSVAFLASYVVYHTYAGSVPFTRQGWVRPVYFTVLITHIVLAIAIVPLAVITVLRAWRGAYARHRQIARWTWPVWMYVSATGVIVYAMLYHL